MQYLYMNKFYMDFIQIILIFINLKNNKYFLMIVTDCKYLLSRKTY